MSLIRADCEPELLTRAVLYDLCGVPMETWYLLLLLKCVINPSESRQSFAGSLGLITMQENYS